MTMTRWARSVRLGCLLGLLLVNGWGFTAQVELAGSDAEHWISDSNGCRAWNPEPQSGESIRWNGGCDAEHRLKGEGTLEWFVNGRLDGRYVGTLVAGKKEGQGEYQKTDGLVYRGQWKDGKPDGRGDFQFPGGRHYVGEIVQGKPEGRGKITESDGSWYEGSWRAGHYEGQGTLHSIDGSVYTGSWRAGRREGQGRQTSPRGSAYQGEWSKDKANGEGRAQYPDGSRYQGNWRDNRREGFGVLTLADGEIRRGQWINDHLANAAIAAEPIPLAQPALKPLLAPGLVTGGFRTVHSQPSPEPVAVAAPLRAAPMASGDEPALGPAVTHFAADSCAEVCRPAFLSCVNTDPAGFETVKGDLALPGSAADEGGGTTTSPSAIQDQRASCEKAREACEKRCRHGPAHRAGSR